MTIRIENWITNSEQNSNNIYYKEKKKLHLYYHFDVVRNEDGKKDLEKTKKHILSRKIQNKPQSHNWYKRDALAFPLAADKNRWV